MKENDKEKKNINVKESNSKKKTNIVHVVVDLPFMLILSQTILVIGLYVVTVIKK